MKLFARANYCFEVITSDNLRVPSINSPEQLINYAIEMNRFLLDTCATGWVYVEKIRQKHRKESVLYAQKIILPVEEGSSFFDESLYAFYTKKALPHQTLVLDDLEDEDSLTEQTQVVTKQTTEREDSANVQELLALVQAQQEQLEQLTKQMNHLSQAKEVRYVPINQVSCSDDPFIQQVIDAFVNRMGELANDDMSTFKTQVETINLQETVKDLVSEQLESEYKHTLDSEEEKIENHKQMKMNEENLRHEKAIEDIQSVCQEDMKASQAFIMNDHEQNKQTYLTDRFPEIQCVIQSHYEELVSSLTKLSFQLAGKPPLHGKNTS